MNETQTISSLSAHAHIQRLRIFRLLVVAGPEGLTPSRLAGELDVARNALSFHLKELSHAGLVTIEQNGRNLIYRADYERMNGLVSYLSEHCCDGLPCEFDERSRCDCPQEPAGSQGATK